MNKEKAKIIIEKLDKTYFGAKPALNFNSEYELLVAVILSAQCTDERVNKVTKILFESYNSPSKMLTLSVDELSNIILPCGLNNSKAKHILGASKSIIDNFDGKVPNNLQDLRTLDGVGRKTANVVYSVAFGGDAIAVDTHVQRVSNRIGLAKSDNPLETEKQLMKKIDKSMWSKSHHYLIYHGRRVCTARSPKCSECVLVTECEYKNKKV
jgi:endonuclease-3